MKNYPGITKRLHRAAPKQTALLKERYAESKKELQSGLDEKWCIIGCLSEGKTPYKQRFGEPFKGQVIPFGSRVEYHPNSAKDQSRLHQFGNKVWPGIFLGYALYAEEFGKETSW